jgi:sterol desaturase/sphingolipid hydroxylase (fatty acid hydroxylase superfamily)
MIVDWIVLYEPLLRFSFFVFGLIVLGALEYWFPFSNRLERRLKRWLDHLFLVASGTGIARVLFQVIPIVFALHVQSKHMGLFETLKLSKPVVIVISIIMLDLFMFLGHRVLHRFSSLWQIHKVHHTDKEIDVTTGLRFHPIEIVILLLMKGVSILFLGAPVIAVFIYEVMFCFFLQFAHANIKIPRVLDKLLRYVIITPQMHRIHHSDIPFEHNSNFGFCFSMWDRFFSTYRAAPKSKHNKLVFGLEQYRLPIFQTLSALLWLPFNIKQYRPKNQTPIRKMQD